MPLDAYQLVYSNVEEDASPHRRRGFQVWLHTHDDGFPEAVRAEVEAALSVFATPAGVSDGSARRLFLPLPDHGRVVVAEMRANPKPDKFGRRGRFHGHALVFDAAEFEREAGNDPFAVFDGEFAFQHGPDGVPQDADWKRGHLPKAEAVPLRRAEAEPDIGPVPDRVVVQLAQWLLTDAPDRPVAALPYGPDDTERAVRRLFALLPAEARPRASFHTLWPGKGKLAPRVAGAGTGEALGLWTHRDVARYDIRRAAFVPPLKIEPGRRADLVAHWQAAGWGRDDREQSWALADWVLGAEALRPPASDAVSAHIGTWPESTVLWEALVADACGRELPGAAADLPAVLANATAYHGRWSNDGFAKLEADIPADTAAGWIADAFRGMGEIDRKLAEDVLGWKNWNDGHPAKAVRRAWWMAARWVPARQHEVRAQLGDSPWLREYCRSTLPEGWQTADAAKAVLDRLLRDGSDADREAARWFVAVCGDEAGDDHRETFGRIAFLVADDHAGWDALWPGQRDWVMAALGPKVAAGLVPFAVEAVDVPPRAGANPFAGLRASPIHIGYRVELPAGDGFHRRALAKLAEHEPATLVGLFRDCVRQAAEAAEVAAGSPLKVEEGAKKVAMEYAKKEKWRELADVIQGHYPDGSYCETVRNNSLQAFAARFLVRRHLASGSVAVGLELSDKMDVFSPIEVAFLKALIGSEVGFRRTPEDAPPPADPGRVRRFHWLLAAFADKAPNPRLQPEWIVRLSS